MIIVIDNYDSFTYNIVQYLGELAAEFPVVGDIQVFRNDKITIDEIRALHLFSVRPRCLGIGGNELVVEVETLAGERR